MKTALLIILSISLIGAGTAAAFLSGNAPDESVSSTVATARPNVEYSPAENVYFENYVPEKVSYWEDVQRFVNQGPAAVKSKWSVGDVFIDCFDGSTVYVTLVDIAEDGTCTFLMDSVLESEMTYDVIHFYKDCSVNEPLYEEDEDGNVTYYALVVRGGLGEYYYVNYMPDLETIEQLTFTYEYHAYGENEPDWRYKEKFVFNVDHSLIPIGKTFDPSLFEVPVVLVEVDLDESRYDYEWVEVAPDYATCVSDDLRNHAIDFRLPSAQELGIGDLKGNGSDMSKVWQHYRSLYSYDGNGLTETDRSSYTVHYGHVGEEEKMLDYTAFAGEFGNFWLEDTSFTTFSSRYYVDTNGDLHVIPEEYPLDTPIAGSFRPCFKIVPQR